MSVRLEFLASVDRLVDGSSLRPQDLCDLSAREIESLPINFGNRQIALGECCRVMRTAGEPDELILMGHTAWISHAGSEMDAGRLVIEGDAGPYTGANMGGGSLEVLGGAGDGLGVAMRGGVLRVRGNAGDWCGASLPGRVVGMTGGVIIVEGSAGSESGAGMRRGLIVIGRDSGEYLGVRLLAGTILCFGKAGAGVGLEMKRGSIVIGKLEQLLPGFRPAGEADLEWLRICMGWLGRLNATFPIRWAQNTPKRFTGDHLVFGKGEVLLYDFAE